MLLNVHNSENNFLEEHKLCFQSGGITEYWQTDQLDARCKSLTVLVYTYITTTPMYEYTAGVARLYVHRAAKIYRYMVSMQLISFSFSFNPFENNVIQNSYLTNGLHVKYLHIDHLEWYFSRFSSVPLGKCRDTPSKQGISKSPLTNYLQFQDLQSSYWESCQIYHKIKPS
jgi:hypothetical protein